MKATSEQECTVILTRLPKNANDNRDSHVGDNSNSHQQRQITALIQEASTKFFGTAVLLRPALETKYTVPGRAACPGPEAGESLAKIWAGSDVPIQYRLMA